MESPILVAGPSGAEGGRDEATLFHVLPADVEKPPARDGPAPRVLPGDGTGTVLFRGRGGSAGLSEGREAARAGLEESEPAQGLVMRTDSGTENDAWPGGG